ncbi:MAG: hypothetical protein K0Q57_458 [Gammaproteobacteria bacterium]|jgi:hypothetical protein|nr:hypothetical protein [Gammaproteobacteria bacterium]
MIERKIKENNMLKNATQILLISGLILLSGCTAPVLKMQHLAKPQTQLSPFGAVEVETFIDERTGSPQLISYHEALKSDSLTSEFLQTSQGLGSSTWYYDTEPKLNDFLQQVMQQTGEKSGFINPNSGKKYLIEGKIYQLYVEFDQALGMVTVNVKFTGVLRKENGVMLMIMPINYSYTEAMTQPLADKSNPSQMNVLLDQALTAASMQMYQSINANFPPVVKKLSPQVPTEKTI